MLYSKIYPDQSTMMAEAVKLAADIGKKSPVAVQVSKINLNYSRDHTVDESLDYMVSQTMSIFYCTIYTQGYMEYVYAAN